MCAVRVAQLRSPQIQAVRELIYDTAQTSTSFSCLLRYCLMADACAFVATAAEGADGDNSTAEGRVVGFISGSQSDAVAMIECLCVDGAYRNLGIATTLIDTFVAQVPASSVCRLDVRLSNSLARQFYARRGFKEVSTKKLFYSNEDGLLMSRPAAYAQAAHATATQTTVL